MGGGSDTQSTKFDPPDWTKELYPQAMQQLTGLVNRPYQQFQGQRVASMNDRQATGGQMLTDAALYGRPDMNQARGSLMNISGGGAANPFMNNAYTDKMISDTAGNMAQAHATGTAAQNDALAARAGAYGGSAHLQKQSADAANLAQQIGQMGTATRQQDITRKGNLWNQDVQNVMQASGMSLPFAQQDLMDIGAMMGYGDKEQAGAQKLLDEGVNEFNRQQNHPLQQFALLMQGLGAGSGQYYTSQGQGPGQSGLANGLGAAGGIAGLLGGMFG